MVLEKYYHLEAQCINLLNVRSCLSYPYLDILMITENNYHINKVTGILRCHKKGTTFKAVNRYDIQTIVQVRGRFLQTGLTIH